jgi:DNA-binding PucR family transcriptional regulator
VDTEDPRAREGIAAVAATMAARLGEISADVQQVIDREIPPLRDDPRVLGMPEASVSENIATMIHSLRFEIDTKGVDAPTSALEYARRLAQRDVDAAALVRAYRLGVARFMRLFIEELHRQTGGEQIDSSMTMRAIEQINSYSDRVVEQVLEAYERERAGWLQNRSAVQATRVRLILDGERFDVDRAEAALGYRLRQQHVGLILWIDGEVADVEPHSALSELVDDIARLAGGSQKPLFVPRDDSSAWAWLPVPPGQWRAGSDLAAVVAKSAAAAAVAVGSAASGPDGFRRTHRQAASAQVVALTAGRSRATVTPFSDVAPIAMMCADIDSARAWVAETLGPLAVASDRNDGLRETARIFLHTSGSFTATADQLYLHRNTVQYRIKQAEELRGSPLSDGRLDVELALLACHWLGAAILQRD